MNLQQLLAEGLHPFLASLPWILASTSIAGAQSLTEEAATRGVDYLVTNDATGGGFGYGAAFADLDGDGDPDLILLGRLDGAAGLYENDGSGHFTDRTASSGILPALGSSGICAGDYDADGDLDLYISYWKAPNVLCRNEGGFQFTDVGAAAGVDDAGVGTGCAWGDYDGDGLLDLYVANRTDPPVYPQPNRLYHNLGGGAFADVAGTLGIDDGTAPSFQALLLDFEADGDTDLYLSTDKGYTPGNQNRLFENLGSSFLDITSASGTAAYFDSMGVAWGDFDGDLQRDLYCTNTPLGNGLFLQESPGVFSDQTEAARVESFETGWGAEFFDADNDGHRELYVCNINAPNRLYRHAGSFPCVDIASAAGVAHDGQNFGLAVADVDDDGDVDFLITGYLETIRLYINQESSARRWVKPRVAGSGSNTSAIGASVEILAGARSARSPQAALTSARTH